jgi:hypothetical protein
MIRVLILLIVLFSSCSTDNDELRESEVCSCERTTITYESNHENATVLSVINETLEGDCNSENSSYFTNNGYYVEITWDCL